MAELLFYVLAVGAAGFAAGVVAARMPLFSVLNLLGAFFCLAGIYLLAGFPFLAATQLLVYAGAIMVLFLFVIMLLNLGSEEDVARNSGIAHGGKRLALASAAAGVLALIGVLAPGPPQSSAPPAFAVAHGFDHLPDLADALFSRYVLAFEATSLLLLATMIAVIALAKRNRGEVTGARAESERDEAQARPAAALAEAATSSTDGSPREPLLQAQGSER